MGIYYHSWYMHGQSVKRSGNVNDRTFDISEYEEQSSTSSSDHNDYDDPYYDYGYGDDSSVSDDRPLDSELPNEPWTYVGCPFDKAHGDDQRNPHTDAIVITTNGICIDNGRPWARAALGVFFHRNNGTFNRSAILPGQVHTSQRAQLYAALHALQFAKDIQARNIRGKLSRHKKTSPLVRLHHVVIKTDSEYVSRGMNEWIWKWEANGYMNAKGRAVVNADLFRAMQQETAWLNARDVHVDFLARWQERGGGGE